MATLLLAIPVIGLVFLVAGLIAVYQGWALSILWAWFVQPLGAPHLGVANAVGLMFLFGLMTSGIAKVETKVGENKGSALFLHLLTPLFALLFGYIAKSFM